MSTQRLVQFGILFWCIPFNCDAQGDMESTQLKNEISLPVLSLNANYGLDYTSDYYINIFNGLGFKRHLGCHAFRLGGMYKDSRSVGRGDFTGKSRYLEGKFNLGYQLTVSKKAVRPYMALDFIYLVSKLNSDFSGGFLGLYSDLNLQGNGIGFAPALGLYFTLIKSLSISWEGNAEFISLSESGTNIRSEPNNFQSRTTYPISNNDHFMILNPLKCISLNYGF